jgi:hypothetical protein
MQQWLLMVLQQMQRLRTRVSAVVPHLALREQQQQQMRQAPGETLLL